MKQHLVYIMLSAAILLMSCKDSSNPADRYGETVVDKYISTQEFGEDITLRNLQQAITTFRLTHGRFPEDIDEVSDFSGMPLDADKYDYDPSTGVLSKAALK
ncbi:MAG: hypothetical protein JSV21_05760 [Nitrospirota bacterium]|nr:MAG: hypothetical protein JSV21_05760 [Nitrospirota bacterium]